MFYIGNKHGKIHTRGYHIWSCMKTRCYNPKSEHKRFYYDKNITICDEWKNNFMSFYEWAMSNGYSDGLSIDRIDGAKGYDPVNCKWSTAKQQTINRKNTVFMTLNEDTKTLKEWSELSGIPYITLYYRYSHGWDVSKILNV